MLEAIADLQAKIAFQEDTINELNTQVTSLNREMQDMHTRLQLVYKKLDEIVYQVEQGQTGDLGIDDERPPHY